MLIDGKRVSDAGYLGCLVTVQVVSLVVVSSSLRVLHLLLVAALQDSVEEGLQVDRRRVHAGVID